MDLTLELLVNFINFEIQSPAIMHVMDPVQNTLYGRQHLGIPRRPKNIVRRTQPEGLDDILFLSLVGDHQDRCIHSLRGQGNDQILGAQAGQV